MWFICTSVSGVNTTVPKDKSRLLFFFVCISRLQTNDMRESSVLLKQKERKKEKKDVLLTQNDFHSFR